MSRILALDIATTVGYAIGDTSDRIPSAGYFELPPASESDGQYFAAFDNTVIDTIKEHAPTVIAYERSLGVGRHSSTRSMELLVGLIAVLKAAAWRRGIDVVGVDPLDARQYVIGRRVFPKGTAKDHVISWCEAQGMRPSRHDVADAIVVWHWKAGRRALTQYQPKTRNQSDAA